MLQRERLGEILLNKGLVRQEDIDAAFKLQIGGRRRMGYLLIKMKKITSDQLLEALSDQLDIPIVSVKENFSKEVRRILPRHMCMKYSVIPLSKEKDNVLRLAMVDPLDYEAITDIETYTDFAVRQVIAHEKEITKGIKKNIPLSFEDVFNQKVLRRAYKGIAAVLVLSMLSIGVFLYFQVSKEKYGEISVSESKKTFRNHDLSVELTSDGLISLEGKGAYSQGNFSVRFENLKQFNRFLKKKRDNFSETQFQWLMWVAENKLRKKSNQSI